MDEVVQPVSSSGTPATLGKRIIAALIDLIVVPILIGLIVGVVLLVVPEGVRPFILMPVNIVWLIVRDMFFAPGRLLMKIKLVSLTGEKVTLVQALLRNLLLIIPFVLIIGYFVELIMLCVKGNRVMDGPAKTQVVEA